MTAMNDTYASAVFARTEHLATRAKYRATASIRSTGLATAATSPLTRADRVPVRSGTGVASGAAFQDVVP
jgi:hypothetical protein